MTIVNKVLNLMHVFYSFIKGFGKNGIHFGIDNTSLIYIDNRKKDILGLTQQMNWMIQI